jgi:hypothetical protein
MHRQELQEHPDLGPEKRRNPHPNADRFRPSADKRFPGYLGAHDADDGDQGRWIPFGQQMEEARPQGSRFPFPEQAQALILRVQLLDGRQIGDGELADSHAMPSRFQTLTAIVCSPPVKL